MQTIQAKVNMRLLDKASRLFTRSLERRVIEILQNARRAGATEVHIANEDGYLPSRTTAKASRIAQAFDVWTGHNFMVIRFTSDRQQRVLCCSVISI